MNNKLNFLQFSPAHQRAISHSEIFAVSKFNISKQKLYSISREKNTVYARFASFLILKHVYWFSITLIADLFNMDRKSIIHGIKRLEDENLADEVIRQFCVMYPSFVKETSNPQVITRLYTDKKGKK